MNLIRTFILSLFALALAQSTHAQNTRLNNALFTGTLNGTPSGGTVDLSSVTLTLSGVSFADGQKITFNPNGTNAGINVGAHTADPSALANGDLWYNSTTNALKARIGGATVELGAGGGGGNVSTDTLWDAAGDLAVGTGGNTATRLPIGTALQTLRVNAGATALEWATGGTGDVAGPASATDNGVVRFDGTTGKLVQNSAVTIADTTGDIVAGKYNGLTIASSTGSLDIASFNVVAGGSTRIPISAQDLTFTGPTTARSFAFPDANATIARTDAGQTFTGTQVFTSPTVTTSLTTGSSTFGLLEGTVTTVNAFGAATTVNIGANAATVLNLGGSTTAAQLRFLEPSASGTNYTAFKAQAQAANITYTLPATVGAAGTFLKDVAGDGILSWAAPSGSGDALTSGTLAQFAATTSAQLRGVLSDESGTGAALFAGGNIGAATGTELTVTGNLTAEGSLVSGVDNTTSGSLFLYSGAGVGAGSEITSPNATVYRSVTLPNAAGEIVLNSATQTLTNKTLSGASNTITNVSLTAGVTGTLPVANGGTGATTLTANNVLLGNGTSAVQVVAPGTSGNVLTSNGTTWQSTAPAGGGGGDTYVVLGSDQSNSTTSFADVTGMTFSVTSGETYVFEAWMVYETAATTTGSKWAVNGPASPTILSYSVETPTAATTSRLDFASTYDGTGASSQTAGIGQCLAKVEGVIKVSASGTFALRYGSEVGSSAVTAKAGSSLRYRKVAP